MLEGRGLMKRKALNLPCDTTPLLGFEAILAFSFTALRFGKVIGSLASCRLGEKHPRTAPGLAFVVEPE
jgi:hypothetical protein